MLEDRTITLSFEEAVCLLAAIDREIEHESGIANDLHDKIDTVYKEHKNFIQGIIDRRKRSIETLRLVAGKINGGQDD